MKSFREYNAFIFPIDVDAARRRMVVGRETRLPSDNPATQFGPIARAAAAFPITSSAPDPSARLIIRRHPSYDVGWRKD